VVIAVLRTHPTDHIHDIDVDAALDFLNTLDLDDGQLIEHFQQPSDAAAWFAERNLIHPETAARWKPADLDHVRTVRGALRDVVESTIEHRTPASASVDLVNAALEARRPARLECDGKAVRLAHRHAETPVADALGVIAEAVVEELADGRPERFRVCANDRCRWTFYDSSPTGKRRWCDMATCGNQAKAARHRARAKQAAKPA